MKELYTVTDTRWKSSTSLKAEATLLHALPLPAKTSIYLSHAAWAMLLSVSPVREEKVAGS